MICARIKSQTGLAKLGSLGRLVWFAFILPAFTAGLLQGQENVRIATNGISATLGPAQIGLAAVPGGAFRLSVSSRGAPEILPSSFLTGEVISNSAPWQPVRGESWVGVKTGAGELLVDPRNGRWTLKAADGRVLIPGDGSEIATGTNLAENSAIAITLGRDGEKAFGVYGCGNAQPSLVHTEAVTGVGNGVAVIPYYWSPDGYAVLAVSANDNLPAQWSAPLRDRVTWNFAGDDANLYLMPAASLRDAARAYAKLTGPAPVPPRWTLGYLQSRWGWQDQAYIEDTLKQFHDRKIPVDAFIYDFEWYTTKPDYELPPEGTPGFSDFNWNTNLFSDPAEQLKTYRDEGVHAVVIRKPRMGNSATLAMIRGRHWDLRSQGTVKNEKFQSRDVDFANPDFRAWYVSQTTNLLAQGISGWWNDEGEGAYTTYFYWNLAEAEALARVKPGRRLWTLNRAFSPGLQRLGAAAWTGDIRSLWRTLAETPASLLNWSLAGMPYGACDIGGYDGQGDPSPEMLTRWMQAGVFFPVMRSHSALQRTPRFPWLYGPKAESAIRRAIQLRYRLIPFYYSLAHETFATGLPLMRPLAMEFPGDPRVANLSDEWLMGSSLLAAPVLQPGGKRTVYFPAGDWFALGTDSQIKGGQSLEITAALDEIPVYVKAGTILPLAPEIQHTSELPGGPLEVQIYPGTDAAFTLVEDDGETTNYQRGLKRQTTFKWDDSARRLTWKIAGAYQGKDVFKSVRVTLLDPAGMKHAEKPLASEGFVSFEQLVAPGYQP